MGNFEDYVGGIKSIQSGTVSLGASPATATISAVNTSKSVLHYLGMDTENDDGGARIELTNSTTVSAYTNDPDWFGAKIIGFQVVEYY